VGDFLEIFERTTAKVEPVNKCLRAFWEDRTLPSGVRGPVISALARLAASCLREMAWRDCDMLVLHLRFEG